MGGLATALLPAGNQAAVSFSCFLPRAVERDLVVPRTSRRWFQRLDPASAFDCGDFRDRVEALARDMEGRLAPAPGPHHGTMAAPLAAR